MMSPDMRHVSQQKQISGTADSAPSSPSQARLLLARRAWSPILPMKLKSLPIVLLAVAITASTLLTGCMTFTSEKIYTPAVYQVSTNAAGILATNLISPAKLTTKKQRTLIPDGYALFIESDMYGGDFEFASASSQYPNIKFGINHSSERWVPTATNKLYAATMAVTGSIDNKAVPFWMSAKGAFTTGDSYVQDGNDTNGNPHVMIQTIVPGTPNNQTINTNVVK